MQLDMEREADQQARLARVEEYLRSDPGNPELLIMAIDLSTDLRDLDRAARHATEARKRHPHDPSLQFRHAHVLLAQGNRTEAAAHFTALLASHQSVNIAYSLASTQLYEGLYAEAMATLTPYCEDPALTPEAVALMVRALHHEGQYEAAGALIEKHHAAFHGNADLCAAASLLFLDAGKLELAERYSQFGLAGEGRPLEALLTSATLALGRTEAATAIEQFAEAIRCNPGEGRGWSGLGMANMLGGDMIVARDQLEHAVKFMPGHIGSWHALGWCRLMTNQLAGAEQAFRAALDIDRNFSESHGAMAVVCAYSGARARAEASILVARRLDPACLSAKYAHMVLNGELNDTEHFKAVALRLIGVHKSPGGESLATVVERLLER